MIKTVKTFQLVKNLYTTKFNTTIGRFAAADKSTEQTDQEKWSEIYRLPLIRLAAAFNKLKIYQAIVTTAGTPVVLALEQAGHLDPNFGFVFGTLGITAVLTLSICSLPIQKLIGFIYMNKENDKIKLGYVDFWGGRKHQILNIENIIPPWEIPDRKINVKILDEINLYQKVTNREDKSQSFKLLNRFGIITDPEKYVRVFGDGYV